VPRTQMEAFIEVAAETLSDGAAHGEINSDGKESRCDANGPFAVERLPSGQPFDSVR